MPQFYQTKQAECVYELEYQNNSNIELNDTSPIQKMRGFQSEDGSKSQVDLFNPFPMSIASTNFKTPVKGFRTPQYFKNSTSSTPFKGLMTPQPQINRQQEDNSLHRLFSSSYNRQMNYNDSFQYQKQNLFQVNKSAFRSQPQTERVQTSNFKRFKLIDQDEQKQSQQQQKQVEIKNADLLARIAALNDLKSEADSTHLSIAEKRKSLSLQLDNQNSMQADYYSRNDQIDRTSKSFADIVRAIQNVNFITPVQRFGRNHSGNSKSSQQQEMRLPRNDSFNTSPEINLNGTNDALITHSQDSNSKGVLSELGTPIASPADKNMFQKAIRKHRKNYKATDNVPQFLLDAFDSQEGQSSIPNHKESQDLK